MSSQLELEESDDILYEDNDTGMHHPSLNKNKSQKTLFPPKVSSEGENTTSSKPTWRFQYNKTNIPKVNSNTWSSQLELEESDDILYEDNDTGMHHPSLNKNKSQKTLFPPKLSEEGESNSILYQNKRINKSMLSLLDDSFKFVDLTGFISNNILVNNDNYQSTYNDFFFQISKSSNSATASENIAICHADLPSSLSEIIEMKSDTLEYNGSELFKNQINISNISDINFDFNVLNVDNEIKTDDKLESLELLNSIQMYTNNETDIENKQCEIDSGNKDDDINTREIILREEFDSYCPHLDGSFSSEPSMDTEEGTFESENEEITVVPGNSKSVNSIDVFTNYEQEKYSEKVVDVDEYHSKDLCSKENLILVNESVSTNTLDNVEVQCLKDYHSGDGDHIIEIYGFSPKLKTVDLMAQFKARKFRTKYVEIISIDDTHALAVFENSYIASRALNTYFGIMKTRSLKTAIKKSKIEAEKIIALLKTRPNTCNSVTHHLVGNALGLKIDASPNNMNGEHTLLANGKGKKIHDTQHKHDI